MGHDDIIRDKVIVEWIDKWIMVYEVMISVQWKMDWSQTILDEWFVCWS